MGLGTVARFTLLCLLWNASLFAGVYSADYAGTHSYLRLQVLDDGLVHFEYLNHPTRAAVIPTSPMIARTDFPGPTSVQKAETTLTTPRFTLTVDPKTLCFRIVREGHPLTQVCPLDLDADWKGLTLTREATRNLYGLGQQFRTPGETNGDWMDSVRTPGEVNGNRMVEFNGGANGNTQIPILYALGEQHANYALFLDSVYKQQWDFKQTPWRVQTWGDTLCGYLFVADHLADLRHAYLELVGKPLVPPKKAFGLWVSEYGYRNWAEMESKLTTLRARHFPVDGFMLDLFWYGGINGTDSSAMGKLAWDPTAFANARTKLRTLREQQGVSVIPIEEPYIAKGLAEHQDLAGRGFLVKNAAGQPAYLSDNPWWGKGGYVDFTNPAANAYWHKAKRVSLIEDGISGFWTDLGEPEQYAPDARYFGGHEADVHNLYNFYWLQGIAKGYADHTPKVRPFMVSRSGTAGIQRFGAGVWSGDIGSDITSLATHLNSQMQMALSGIDYYGADIGGFHREALHGDLNDTYTRWFADGTLFDVPVRPHTENLCQCKETAPDRIGDPASNLRNLRQRYELIPYLYSLAHQAHEDGEPVFPPLVYHFESDTAARVLGDEKMIGPWLLARALSKNGETAASVYLPAGRWFEFHDDSVFQNARGRSLSKVRLQRDNRIVPPLYVRAGAILPLMEVDDATLNALGKRSDGPARTSLRARVYPDRAATHFDLIEDDGETTGYLHGELRRTRLSQVRGTAGIEVTIAPAQGKYDGAPSERDALLEIVDATETQTVLLNDHPLAQLKTAGADSGPGWWRAGTRVYVRTGVLSVDRERKVTLRAGR